MIGWIKIHRKIMSNSLWNEPFDKARAWIDLILLANFEPGYVIVRGIQVEIMRGQVGWSEPRLAQRWQWSRSKVRGFLKLLEKEQQIRIEKNNVTQVLTIINYAEYQHEKTADRTAEGQQTVQQKDSNKEVNKNEEIKKLNIPFDDFWNLYDKKVGKIKKLEGKWNSLNPQDREEIMKVIPKYKQATPDKQFRKNPATYLNNRAWEDEIIISDKRVNGSHIGDRNSEPIFQPQIPTR